MNLKIVKITNDRAYGFCPFHNDTKPSFEVKLTGEHYGEYFCWGCGRTGTLAQVAMDTLLARKKSKPSINKKVTPINWDNLNGKYGMTYFFDADKLGKPFECSRMSLNHLHCGWDGKKAFTFPMRNGNNEIIGIQRRFSDGKKIDVEGSRLGLFIPQTVNNT